MSDPTTSKDTPNATSSPESADGRAPFDSRCGQTIDLFGQVAPPVNHSARPANLPGNRMSATFGRIGIGSSLSTDLQRFLESKLRQQLPRDGGMMWQQTWRRRNTPARRQYCQLVPSARHIAVTESGLWPTPNCQNTRSPSKTDAMLSIQGKPRPNGAKVQARLQDSAAFWPTPRVTTNGGHGNPERSLDPTNCRLEDTAYLWATPTANDHRRGTKPPRPHDTGIPLPQMASSAATTGKTDSLNPAFPCWLMGYPKAWESCADLVTP